MHSSGASAYYKQSSSKTADYQLGEPHVQLGWEDLILDAINSRNIMDKIVKLVSINAWKDHLTRYLSK